MIHYVFRNTKVRPCLLSKSKFHPTSKEEIRKILTENHYSELAGHPGVTRTYHRIKERYYWKTMKLDIKDYVKRCSSCQINKTNHRPIKAPM